MTTAVNIKSGQVVRNARLMSFALAMVFAFAPGACSAGQSVIQPKPVVTERLLGDWYIVGRSKNWLERHMLHPTARFQQDGPNRYITTVGFDRGENTPPCVHAMESWFDDPGTNLQWRERLWGPIVMRSSIVEIGTDYMVSSSVTKKEFWLLSRTKRPSEAALAAFNSALASSGVPQDTIDWPYRHQ